MDLGAMAPSRKAGTEAAKRLSARGRENMVRTVDAVPAQQGVSVRSEQGGALVAGKEGKLPGGSGI